MREPIYIVACIIFFGGLIFLAACLLYWIARKIENAVIFIGRKLRRRKVIATSTLLPKVSEVNADWQFNDVKRMCSHHLNLGSKAAYDRFDPDRVIIDIIEERAPLLMQRCEAATDNALRWRSYIRAIESLRTTGYDSTALAETERALLKEAMLSKPVTEIQLEVSWSYRSPMGRNYYHGASATIRRKLKP